MASKEPETITADNLGWATTGNLNSRDHLAVIEAWQNRTLCGRHCAGIGEIRPSSPNLCPGCKREAKRLGIDPMQVGIENELTSERHDG
jgi:hypothetical protein